MGTKFKTIITKKIRCQKKTRIRQHLFQCFVQWKQIQLCGNVSDSTLSHNKELRIAMEFFQLQ